MKFLIDKEIDLNKQDFLNTSSYSKALREVINSSPKNNSFTIGLFGEWGSGKSSIVKTVEEEFSKTKKVKFVIYDSWKYSNDSFRRMFLLKLQGDLGFDKTEKFESFYRNKTSDLSINRKIERKYIVATSIVFVLGIAAILYLPHDETEFKITLAVLVTFLGILINVIGRAFNDYKVTVQEPMIFAPEQFEECFKEMIPRVFEKGITLDIAKWIKGDKYVSGLEKLVIVIDNIDRCPKDKAYEMITNIKSFLSTQKNVVFLIPVDDAALKRHIIKEENNDTKEAEEFLRKFFNVTIRLKPFKRFDLYDFTNKLNKDNQLNFNPTTIDIISKEYATNPRRILQFFNDLMSELKIFELNQDVEFIKIHESLICKMLILRQEWPDFYKIISKNAHLINEPDTETKKLLKKNSDLSSFLTVTDSITKNETISVIENILSTFDRESKLSTELISFIDKKDIKEIEKYVSNKEVDKDDMIDFLIERLNTGIKRKTYRTEVNNVFELLCALDSSFKLNKTQNERIETEVRYNLIDFFKFISNSDLLVSYGHRLKTQGLSYLDDFLTQFLNININNTIDEESYPFAKSFFRTYIKNIDSKPTLKTLNSLFEVEYNRSASKLDDYELDSEQLSDIVNEQVIENITAKIAAVDYNDIGFKEIVYASENIDFTNNSFKTIISKFNELIPALTNWSKEQVIQYISLFNDFLIEQHNVVSKDTIEKDVLLTFKTKLLSNRSVSNRQISIYSETLTQEEVSVLSNFLKYIYACSNYNIEILQELTQLVSESPNDRQEIINKNLIELKNEFNYTLIPIKNVILNDNSNTSTSLELFEYISTSKEKKEYSLDEGSVSNKLERIVKSFTSDINNQIIKEFLNKIIKDERAKSLLSSIISKLAKDDILLLPKNLQVLSFDKILEGDTIYEYEEQIDFLKAIASIGEKKHINKLIKVITRKMTINDKLEEGIDILSEVRELKDSDRRLIEGVVESIEDEKYKERATEILKKLG
jgi:hypothetical protein